jgi:phosphoribosylamine--glycine ligase/phosphoribosylaminoimidazole synthetase
VSSSHKRNILVLGSGGREHALAWAASRSPRCADLVVAPGNAGTPGQRADVVVDDPANVVALARQLGSDLVLVGPDAAIAAGVVDALNAAGIAAFGATQAASELEWSKAFARGFCDRHRIASPAFAVFHASDSATAISFIRDRGLPMVVKADGLAAGKGVVVPSTVDETVEAIVAIAESSAHTTFILEEFLTGEEVSLLAFCDGKTVSVMPPAQDHKRLGEGDVGPNTGGMGAYAPAPVCPPDLIQQLVETVLQPAVDGCAAEGRPFQGILYAGIMLTPTGPKVLEFNCRFGDPEAQALLPLLTTDIIDIAEACINGNLAEITVAWSDQTACTVVLASAGYPGSPTVGEVIEGLATNDEALVFHAGTAMRADGQTVTGGGRVLATTALGATIHDARASAYKAAQRISFAGKQMRRDIGWRAIARSTGGYAASGVSIDEGERAVALLKPAVEKTHSSAVLAGVGAFGGAFDASVLKTMDHPVLVASTDGVGTKVALAAEHHRLRGVGMDIVGHCVNDVLVQNARPLFFLDYFASSKIQAEDVAEAVAGMSAACAENGCTLLGGETAEMPGVYHDGHIDIAGTLIGAVDKATLLPRPGITEGDVLIGMASNGPHTNGYSLLRRIFAGIPLDATPAPLQRPLIDALLEPHRCYLPPLATLLDGEYSKLVKALVHVTGGGLIENLPRVFPHGLGADVMLGSWPVPPLFQLVRDVSGLAAEELHRTLNMGIGMVIVCAPDAVAKVQSQIDEPTWVIGSLVALSDSRGPAKVQLR